MNKLIGKRYYQISFTLKSALSIGNGENNNTDKDSLLSSAGKPYIPASSLAGVYRSLLNEEDAKKYFGYMNIADNKNKAEIKESELIIYDATIVGDDYRITTRDGVKLDEYKTAIDKSKYDYEILEPGCTFITYVEQDIYDDSKKVFDDIARQLIDGNIYLGGKTSRGLGEIGDVEIKTIDFNMTTDIDKWLDFDMYDNKDWKELDINQNNVEVINNKIIISLKQDSALSIREYRTDFEKDKNLPDYQQMTYKDGRPVIPGTSWAGMFKRAIINYGVDETIIDELFGTKNKKSKVVFSETILDDAITKVISRNSIDRFSGGTVDNALFTESVCYGGKGVLNIVVPKYKEEYKKAYKALCAAIADLNEGLLAIGGETSIGHGLFKIESIIVNKNQIKFSNSENIYTSLTKQIIEEDNSNEQL